MKLHCHDAIMSVIASQITSLAIVYLAVYSGTDQRKHQSSASLAFVRGIHRWLVNSPHKWPVTRKMFPFNDIIMTSSSYLFDAVWRWQRFLPDAYMSADANNMGAMHRKRRIYAVTMSRNRRILHTFCLCFYSRYSGSPDEYTTGTMLIMRC